MKPNFCNYSLSYLILSFSSLAADLYAVLRRTVRRRLRLRSRERLVQLPQAEPLLPRLPQALRRLPQEAACASAVAFERRRHNGQAHRKRERATVP